MKILYKSNKIKIKDSWTPIKRSKKNRTSAVIIKIFGHQFSNSCGVCFWFLMASQCSYTQHFLYLSIKLNIFVDSFLVSGIVSRHNNEVMNLCYVFVWLVNQTQKGNFNIESTKIIKNTRSWDLAGENDKRKKIPRISGSPNWMDMSSQTNWPRISIPYSL